MQRKNKYAVQALIEDETAHVNMFLIWIRTDMGDDDVENETDKYFYNYHNDELPIWRMKKK